MVFLFAVLPICGQANFADFTLPKDERRKSVEIDDNSVQSKTVFYGTELSDKFNIKDQINQEHYHILVYMAICS